MTCLQAGLATFLGKRDLTIGSLGRAWGMAEGREKSLACFHTQASNFFEKQGRAAGTHDPVGYLGNFQFGIDLDRDPFQFAKALESLDKILQAIVCHRWVVYREDDRGSKR